MQQHFVYMLREINGNRTYIGYTVNLERRIRQHNGEIKGGAKYTSGRKWEYAFHCEVTDKISGLQIEWRFKRKRGGLIKRLAWIQSLLSFYENKIVEVILHV